MGQRLAETISKSIVRRKYLQSSGLDILDEELSGFGFNRTTIGEVKLLLLLWGETKSPNEISNELKISRPMLYVYKEKPEKLGLISSRKDYQQTKRVHHYLTEKGEKFLETLLGFIYNQSIAKEQERKEDRGWERRIREIRLKLAEAEFYHIVNNPEVPIHESWFPYNPKKDRLPEYLRVLFKKIFYPRGLGRPKKTSGKGNIITKNEVNG